jgi:hypothetical protein
MSTNKNSIIAMSVPVQVTAAESEGEKPSPPRFDATFYTGGALEISGWDLPVIVDLAGLDVGNVLVANLDHDRTKRVGNFQVANDGKTLVAHGTATAANPAAKEVVESAANGYQWQGSLEVNPKKVEEVKAGKTVEVNGQTFTGPAYVTRKGVLKGFAFVSHGADDNTTVSIAAIAATSKENEMDKEFKNWVEAMGFDADSLSDEQRKGLEANFDGKQPKKVSRTQKLSEGMDAKRVETERVDGITEIALAACDRRPYDIENIKTLAESAIDAKWTVDKFRMELLEASLPPVHYQFKTKRDDRMSNKVVEAAICQSGRLVDLEKQYDDETLQLAHDKFKGGVGLKQLFLMCAEQNGYRGNYASDVNLEVQRAAFGMQGPRQIHAQGWSTLDIQTILSNVANKFLRDGWNAVDMTPMRIASIRSVRDFKQITTVSLTGDLMFEELGSAGEIKHGQLGDLSYSNKADTYAKMLAITRQDIINDDLGALTAVPRRLGRGSALKLNDLFWTVFLGAEAAGFIAGPRNNFNEAVADMSVGGLSATETMFLSQTDPDGKPLGIMPAILVVPTALKSAALTLMNSQYLIDGTSTDKQGSTNVFNGRFRVESSPYMHNSSYTGYSASEWYMIADPNELPMIEIAALNGRVEPTVETADADFNVLGVQMRGYSDVGVALQEYRAVVKADGGTS